MLSIDDYREIIKFLKGKNWATQISTDDIDEIIKIERKKTLETVNNLVKKDDKDLSVILYKIDFNKHQSIYTIEVPPEVKEVKVTAIAEATNAKVEVTGADNLEENNNKIIINVTAENNEVKKYIMSNNNNYMGMNYGMNYQNINQVNIYDCFNYYQNHNEITGYCDLCGLNDAKINMITKIFTLPNILMIIFNRGKGLQYKIKIIFDEILDLSNIVMNAKEKYELLSVVKHLGDSSASGHFIAYCRSPFSNNQNQNRWFCYNDETVVPVNDFKNSIVDTGDTYILFYQKKEQ